jgi:hypothetical protein
MLASTLALGGVVAASAMLLPLEAGTRTSALIGALVAAALGALAIVLKTQLGKGLTGAAALKVMMTSLGLTFMLRLLAVGLGAVVLKQDEALSPMAFVIAFFISSLLQQVLETRSLLSSLPASPVNSVNSAKPSQVIS